MVPSEAQHQMKFIHLLIKEGQALVASIFPGVVGNNPCYATTRAYLSYLGFSLPPAEAPLPILSYHLAWLPIGWWVHQPEPIGPVHDDMTVATFVYDETDRLRLLSEFTLEDFANYQDRYYVYPEIRALGNIHRNEPEMIWVGRLYVPSEDHQLLTHFCPPLGDYRGNYITPAMHHRYGDVMIRKP